MLFCCHGYITQTSSQSEVEDWTTAIHCGEYLVSIIVFQPEI